MKDKESEYVTETIKKRPVNFKKIIKKIFSTIFLAILFGIVATTTVLFLYPKLKDRFFPNIDMRIVSLPITDELEDSVHKNPLSAFINGKNSEAANDEGITNAKAEENTSEASDSKEVDASSNADEISSMTGNNTTIVENAATIGDDSTKVEGEKKNTAGKDTDSVYAGIGPSDNLDSDSSEAKKENSKADTDNKSDVENDIVIDQIPEVLVKELEIDDYKELMSEISAVATNAQKSLVTVSGKSSDTDWFNNPYESHNSSIGFIVADNGKELLIISPKDCLKEAAYVDVTFNDGNSYRAAVKKSDNNTGLCVVAVQLSNISEDTLESIEYAQFGSLSSAVTGTPILAVGSPYGTNSSSALGQVTSTSMLVDKTDSNVSLISTDIYGSSEASGVLVNFNGRIVGVICHETAMSDMPNLIHAYSIADISPTIEKISNGKAIAEFGIVGTDVTQQANEEYGVPLGAYVKKVVMDSPAMNVGMRNGDVITKINDTVIKSFDDYEKAILESLPDEVIKVTLMRPSGDNYTSVIYEATLKTN